MNASMIHVQLEFASVLIPIANNEKNQPVVPLKPISDVFGLDWENQRKKISQTYLAKRLGTCTVFFNGANMGREMTAIRLDRVAIYLYTLNPDLVRNKGNESAADFLEARHAEWDDLIHRYESAHGVLAKARQPATRKAPTYNDFLKITTALRKAETEPQRQALDFMARQIARDLGAPDFSDSPEGVTSVVTPLHAANR